MKRFLPIIMALFFCSASTVAEPNREIKKVLISQVVEHPALNKTTQGIIAGLADKGYAQGVNLDLRTESAQANAALAAQIANKFVTQTPDIVVGVGTISAQSFIKYAVDGKVKLVFSSVTDPVSASLAVTATQGNPNMTGVSNFVALQPQLELFKSIQPKLTKLGIIYNPGELNSVSLVLKLQEACQKMNIVLVQQAVTKTADVAQAAVKLSTQVDAIFISNDNTALSSLQSIIRAANQRKIPVYVSDTDAVADGAIAALGPNQFEVGKETGYMIANILGGANINSIRIEYPDKTELYVNETAAKNFGLTIPSAILAQAKIIKS